MEDLIRAEIEISTSRSSGAGGQNVNKVNSKITIRFNVHSSPLLSGTARNRFNMENANQINSEGQFVMSCDIHRSQKMNLDSALKKLEELIKKAHVIPKLRKKTKPTKSSVRKRLDSKKRAGVDKKLRREKF